MPAASPERPDRRFPPRALTRRSLLLAAGAAAALGRAASGAADAAEAAVRDFEDLAALAEGLASGPHRSPRMELPEPLASVTYDRYRGIRHRLDRQLWAQEGRGFTVDLMHPGLFYRDAVAIRLVRPEGVAEVPFDPERFDYETPELKPASAEGLGYTGFRVRYPIKTPDYLDEVTVFQGATYFRAVGRRHVYGLSARGLALGTADPAGEEFPAFTAFWLVEPEPAASSLTILGLMESPSATGAFECVLRPGETTTMDIRTALFPRVELATVGLAPLTSMFWFDPSSARVVDDYRPAVHDSNGLQMVTGSGERLWRPLANHATLQVSAFSDRAPRGFGLVQRARDFADFEDAEARYDLRPSGWVEPAGDWGEGAVILVEIPVADEFNDNIVAFWRPRTPLAAGRRHDFAYRLHWTDTPPDDMPIPRVASTRTGVAPWGPGRLFVIDYAGAPGLVGRAAAKVAASAGAVADVTLQAIPSSDWLRLAFRFDPGGEPMAELRADLTVDGAIVAESWLYRWTA